MIVVTGAAGFIGSQIVLNLDSKNQSLILVERQGAFKETRYLRELETRTRIFEAEEFLGLLDTMKDISCVIHMGAITNTAETDLDALKKWNVDYSKTLWNFCQERKIDFIYASSAATFGDGVEGFSDTHDLSKRLKPLNPYGRSKNEFDLYALAQPQTPPHWYGLKFFNVYGPNEAHKGRMASAVWHGYNQVKKTGSMTLFKSHNPQFKDGDQARDFIYVGDVLKVVDFLMAKKPASGIYNCGTGHAGTFMDLAQGLFKTLGRPVKINWVDTPEEFRAAYQYSTQAQMEKLKKAGYSEPFTPLNEGIAKYLSVLESNARII